MDRSELDRIQKRLFKDFKAREEVRVLRDDIPTFMEFPLALSPQDLHPANVAFLGVPYEGVRPYSPRIILPPQAQESPLDEVYFRTGVAQGPEWVRRWSIQHSILHYDGKGYFVEQDINIADYINLVDYGDVDCVPGRTMTSLTRAKDRIEEIIRAGAIPLVMGGDHSITIPGLLALAGSTSKKCGIIGFDTHFDLMGLGETETEEDWNPAVQYIKALQTPNFEPENIVLIGMKGIRNPRLAKVFADELGIRYYTIKDIDELGMSRVAREAVERAGDGTDHLYVTLDIDVVDSSACPGTRFPDTPGLTPREVVQALRIIGSKEVISGFDIACLSPRHDPGGSTPYLAARCFLEVIAGLAVQFRERGLDKWFG